MLPNKLREFKLLGLPFGLFLEKKMDLLDAINTCKEMMLVLTLELCVKVL